MHVWRAGLLIGLLAACAPSGGAGPENAPEPAPTANAPECDCSGASAGPGADAVPTRIAMRDVELVLPDGILRVRYLEGTVESVVKGQPPTIDDPGAYRIVVDRAEVAVDVHTLNTMMSAEHATSGKKTPLASAEFSTEGGLLVVSGKKPVPFVLKGAASVDAKGRMTIRVVELKALGVQTKGILAALDLKLEDLIDVTNERGVTIEGNVVHVDPLVNMPAPKVEAKVTGVSVEADGLVLRLGDVGTTSPETPTSPTAKSAADTEGSLTNFLSYTGGTVVQGKLTIRDTAIKLVDLDPTDPLRLAIDAINAQIAAGFVKITETGDMTTFLPDADQLEDAVAVENP
ncbi:MAG: hypothetical protein Q8P18_32650 [Pseudomonadota bacterium]|nr:hypothetical protein [Pseudomonadota bacterium]